MQLHSEQLAELNGNLEISHKQAFRSGSALASVLPSHKHCEASRNTLENLCQQRTGDSGFGWFEPTIQVWWPFQNSGWNLSGGLPMGASSRQHQVGKKLWGSSSLCPGFFCNCFVSHRGYKNSSSFSSQDPQSSSGVLLFQDDCRTAECSPIRSHLREKPYCNRVPPEPGCSWQAEDHRNHIVCKSPSAREKPLIGRRHRPDVFIVSMGSDPKAAVDHGKSFTSAS